ncbi:Gfo/Idh/MocA family protein [Paenibacillus sp. 1001270B_150601_E10]|uniref:Gfo/Idh/MocA family protein n=1 Tax=Paenibacillus sp. 1001270B_150601_E10 TaxID=2787079 RepID=UPI00189FD2E5|nr:Gfo/Idh/MocA family oxidoreductase [Paenibacillus sp. 1001270B_150601_E10]
MNIAVVGLGSMGKRRIGLVKQYLSNINIFGIDLREDRRSEVASLFGISTYSTLSELFNYTIADAVMVCTSPLSHEEIIKEALTYSSHIFTEINLLHNYYAEVMQIAQEQEKVLFLSSTMLYRKEVQYIGSLVDASNKKISYRYHVGQYLKDWHPWESYQDFFISNKRTNGCREIFAIELPWLVDVFGDIESFHVEKSELTSLDIDYPDYYSVIIRHRNGIVGSVNIDVVSRVARRDFQIIGEELQIHWDGSPLGLEVWNDNINQMEPICLYERYMKDNAYSKSIIEDAYYEEIKEFWEMIMTKSISPRYSFEKDREILQIIDRIEGEL